MILSNPRKDHDTLRACAAVRPWAVAVDSEEELERLAEAGIPGGGYAPVLFARIKVPTKGVKQDLSSKFGLRVLEPDADPARPQDWEGLVRIGELAAVLALAKRQGFGGLGLAFHVGTQCADPRAYHNAFRLCRMLALRLAVEGLHVTWLDLGGGFADARVAAEAQPALDALLLGDASLRSECANLGPVEKLRRWSAAVQRP